MHGSHRQHHSAYMNKIEIFTDGACSGNPGPGGWGVLLRENGEEREMCGGEKYTTNNRMELIAVIQALQSLPAPYQVTLTTDSRYVCDGICAWLPRWKNKNWRKSDGKPVLNKDLWQQLDNEVVRHQIEWRWVKGHSQHRENDIADQLARSYYDK